MIEACSLKTCLTNWRVYNVAKALGKQQAAMDSSTVSRASVLRFGVFELDCRAGELRKSGLLVHLPPQPFNVLALLASHPGRIVTRENIHQQIWGDETFVDFEQGLNHCVRQIRSVLGDDAETPRYIETLPRRGYRFIGPVEAGTASREHRSSTVRIIVFSAAVIVAVLGALLAFNVAGLRNRLLGPATGTPLIHSIAVLPFVNLSGDPEQEYFADGMTDELITKLSKISALRVISRASVMRYKGTKKPLPEIAHELNVDAVIEASVLRSGNRVRINSSLVDGSTERILWERTYERDLVDILSLFSNVASAIAGDISVTVTPKEQQRLQAAGTVNPAAHDAYLRGRYLLDQRYKVEGARATQYFRKAIELDPGYAPAYAGLAMSLTNQFFLEVARPEDVMPRARAAARHALQLDPDSGEAYTALGAVEIYYDWDWKAAKLNLQRGIQLNPSDPFAERFYAWYSLAAGKAQEAVIHARKAVNLDPVSFTANRDLGSMLYFARRYDESLAQLQRAEELQENPNVIDNWRSFVYEQENMKGKAVRADLNLLASFGESGADLAFLRSAYARGGWKGYWQARIELLMHGRKAHYGPYFMRGIYYLRVGNVDEAFRWLTQAVDHHSPWLIPLAVDPKLDAIRSDSRFQALLHRMNLPLVEAKATR
jgi:TolB-like protein/DNA-binding winged helix-turn-helix (wHTH) protein